MTLDHGLANLLAVISAVVSAVLDVAIRASQRDTDRSWAIGVVGSWAGAIVLLPFCLSAVPALSVEILILFILQGALWAIAVFLDFKAMVYCDAASNVLISTTRTVLLAIVGWIFFDEIWGNDKYIGALLVTAGVLYAVAPDIRSRPRGVLLRMGSVITAMGAIICDKILIQSVGLAWPLVMSYLVPGVLFLLIRPSTWRQELTGFTRRSWRPFAIAIALYVASGPVLLAAYGYGELSSTFMISQSRIILVLILSSLVLKETENAVRHWIGCILTIIGVAMVI